MRLKNGLKKKMNKHRVLFICTHNSARSQMAEGLLRNLYGDRYEAYSAGIEPTKIHPFAIEVMDEIGIDISNHHAKNVSEFKSAEFDYVVTVCDNAKETCPFFPGAKEYIHKSFEDPSQYVGAEKNNSEFFGHLRDEIKEWIEKTFSY
jgi:arsenate reductase